jgi:hypothetical protein
MKLRFHFIISFFFLIFITLSATQALASACCGGNFSGPALITGDDQALISQTYNLGRIQTNVEANGLWRKRDNPESLESLNLQASHIFWDRWQAGLGVPVIRRSQSHESSSGLGDVAATLGYEYLPDWDYHPIRPKGVGYLQLVAPTGKSIQESDSPLQLEARGRGFWTLGIGTMLTKTFTRWDLFSSLDVHRSFEKNYANSQASGKLVPGWGESVSLGGGYHIGNYRLGSSVAWNYEDAVEVRGDAPMSGAPQRFITASASLSYAFEHEWSLTAQYSDQSLLGSPSNTTLSQSFSLQIQKRWLR